MQNTSPSLYTNETCKSNLNNNSSKVYLLFFSDSAINKIVLYFGQCIAICGPEFQRTSVITYFCFYLLFYKNEGKKTICNGIKNCDWLVLFLTFAMNTTQVSFESLFPRQLSATNRAFVVRSILVDYFYIE